MTRIRFTEAAGLVFCLCAASAMAGEGSFVFSKSPIDPANPQNLTNSFAAGDTIYGLIQLPATWRELGNAQGKEKLEMAVYTRIDEQKLGAWMQLSSAQHMDAKHLLFDVAPALDAMTAYKDDGILYGDAGGGIKKGACQLTEYLAKQTPGKHVVRFFVRIQGKEYAPGEFVIEGQDYSAYQKTFEAIKKSLAAARTMPPAKMTDAALEAEMVKLLKDAGWTDVLKLHIVDKDWWIDRVAGGDTMVKSKHIAAAAAYKSPTGEFYYKNCTFHRMRLLSGDFGPLKITHQSEPVQIAPESLGEAAVDKGPDMSAVAAANQPDFTSQDAVLADIERMRLGAMKKKVFALVGRCGTAKNQVTRAFEKKQPGYEAEVKRIWLDLHTAYQASVK